MPVASISSDYTGRKKDISILQYPDATLSPEDVTNTSFAQAIYAKQTVFPKFGKVTRYCAGVQKLIQKYTIMLLTGLGSQPKYPDFGSMFMPELQAGLSPTSRLLATQYFMLASYSVVNTLIAYQIDNDDIPDDERIADATLVDLTLQSDYVAFKIEITTEAGDNIDFLVPLPK
jgi:hypothetical protein